MSYKQLHDADMRIGYEGGWCLKYVQDAFKTDHPYPTARAAWDANYGGGNHAGEPPLGITVPIYLTINGVPAGHVAIRLDDGYVASSTLPGVHGGPYYHKNIQDLIDTYARVYGGMSLLGWSEYVGTVRVVEWVADKVLATADQIKQAYIDILGRPFDDGGLAHYLNDVRMTIEEVRADMMASPERAERLKREADAAAAAAAKAQAEADAAREAAEEAARLKAEQEAEAARIAAEQAAKQQAIDDALAKQKETDQAAVNDIQNFIRENNSLLKQILALLLRIFK